MSWASGCLLFLVVSSLVLPLLVSAQEGVITPNYEQIAREVSSKVSSELSTQLSAQTGTALLDRLKEYNDENFAKLDESHRQYTMGLMQVVNSTQQKMVLGIIGAQFVVSGLVYYFLIKNMKDLSFQSINLKRKKEVEDRQWMVDNINYLRGQSEKLENSMRNVTDKLLYNFEQLANQRREMYAGPVYPGGQDQQQQSSMAQQGNVQGYDGYKQEQAGRDQYEQQAYSQGWDGRANY